MGSQQYGIGAGLQSLGASIMQAATMYELLNEDPKEDDEVLSKEEKIKRKKEQAIVDSQTMNTDEDIANAYDGLNTTFGADLTQEKLDESGIKSDFNNFKNFGEFQSNPSLNQDLIYRNVPLKKDPYRMIGGY